MRYTLAGDANLDGKVNASDFDALASNYGKSGANLWTKGDFNYDGLVNVVDFNLLASNYNAALSAPALSAPAPLGTLVPEPGTIGLVSLLGLLPLRRRRSR